jgi:hypothetical protein
MLVFLALFRISASSKYNEKKAERFRSKNNAKIYNIFKTNRSSNKVLLADPNTPICPGAYKDALAKLKVLVSTRKNFGNLLGAEETAAQDALGIFISQCDTTYDVKDCKDVVDAQVKAADDTGYADFLDECAVKDPTADLEGCFGAYGALVEALEALKPPAVRLGLKATVAELTEAFLTKCPKTVNELKCFGTLATITGTPAYDDLESIQKNCKVEDPSSKNEPDLGLLSFTTSSKLIFWIYLIISFYFMV